MVPDSPVAIARYPASLCRLLILVGVLVTGEQAIAGDSGHARVVELAAASNTRDIGGYDARDGRHIRWGRIYRSGELSRLTAEDFKRLEALGIRTVIDLRNSAEVEKSPTHWPGSNPPQFIQLPIGKPDGWWVTNQSKLLRSGRFTAKESHEHLLTAYRNIHSVGADAYRRLFDIARDESNWPILIHCSAGKDRTGIAVALLMESLGVGRESIMADFLLTNEVARTRERSAALAAQIAEKTASTGWRTAPRPLGADAYFPFLGVTPDMLNAFYDSVVEHYGSVDAYLTHLDVDPADRERLVNTLTE